MSQEGVSALLQLYFDPHCPASERSLALHSLKALLNGQGPDLQRLALCFEEGRRMGRWSISFQSFEEQLRKEEAGYQMEAELSSSRERYLQNYLIRLIELSNSMQSCRRNLLIAWTQQGCRAVSSKVGLMSHPLRRLCSILEQKFNGSRKALFSVWRSYKASKSLGFSLGRQAKRRLRDAFCRLGLAVKEQKLLPKKQTRKLVVLLKRIYKSKPFQKIRKQGFAQKKVSKSIHQKAVRLVLPSVMARQRIIATTLRSAFQAIASNIKPFHHKRNKKLADCLLHNRQITLYSYFFEWYRKLIPLRLCQSGLSEQGKGAVLRYIVRKNCKVDLRKWLLRWRVRSDKNLLKESLMHYFLYDSINLFNAFHRLKGQPPSNPLSKTIKAFKKQKNYSLLVLMHRYTSGRKASALRELSSHLRTLRVKSVLPLIDKLHSVYRRQLKFALTRLNSITRVERGGIQMQAFFGGRISKLYEWGFQRLQQSWRKQKFRCKLFKAVEHKLNREARDCQYKFNERFDRIGSLVKLLLLVATYSYRAGFYRIRHRSRRQAQSKKLLSLLAKSVSSCKKDVKSQVLMLLSRNVARSKIAHCKRQIESQLRVCQLLAKTRKYFSTQMADGFGRLATYRNVYNAKLRTVSGIMLKKQSQLLAQSFYSVVRHQKIHRACRAISLLCTVKSLLLRRNGRPVFSLCCRVLRKQAAKLVRKLKIVLAGHIQPAFQAIKDRPLIKALRLSQVLQAIGRRLLRCNRRVAFNGLKAMFDRAATRKMCKALSAVVAKRTMLLFERRRAKVFKSGDLARGILTLTKWAVRRLRECKASGLWALRGSRRAGWLVPCGGCRSEL